jgi:integrase
MSRPRGSAVQSRALGDGTVRYFAKVTLGSGDRRTVTLGSSREGMDAAGARVALQRVQAQILLGQWEQPAEQSAPERVRFASFAGEWCMAKRQAISPRGADYNDWALRCHLLPFFGSYPLAEIDVALVDRYVRAKLAEREELTARLAAGERLTDNGSRPLRPLANSTINKTLDVLSGILATAYDHRLIGANPALGRARRLRARKPRRTWLMPDQVIDIIDAAERIDRTNRPQTRERATRLQELRARGLTLTQAASQLGVAPSMASYLASLTLTEREPSIRRAIIATLALGGLRASELCALCWRDIDLANRRIVLAGTKSAAAQRPVRIVDFLLAELVRWRDDAPSSGPDLLVFPSPTGARRTKDTLRKDVVAPALREANRVRRLNRAVPLEDSVTPHTFRRTFVALMLASGQDIKSVQRQAGHEDALTTLNIYGQVIDTEFAQAARQLERLCAYTVRDRSPRSGRQVARANGTAAAAVSVRFSPALATVSRTGSLA